VADAAEPTGPKTVVTQGKRGPNFFVRVLWYIFIGWWLTGISLAIGYLAGLTIIGLPLAFWIFNRTGTLLTLRPRSQSTTIVQSDGTATVTHRGASQRPLLLRAVWFVLIGWWAALIWMIVSYLISLTIIGIPVGIMMLNRLPAVFTLHRN
jgi:uncharacterized membrane protein YccF (DUF307 family)